VYVQQIRTVRPTHTYSIVAVDNNRGEIGAAVQSHWFSVGSTVPWAEAGVGAVVTQSFVNPSLGPRGLELLKQGLGPEQVVERLVASDAGREMRQLAVVDRHGRAFAFTGRRCIPEAGHRIGEDYSVQANLMENGEIWPTMAKTFEQSSGPLAERMVEALAAAQDCGGDLRGKQSAAVLIVRGESSGEIWKDRVIDLRVEDHEEPVEELRRLLDHEEPVEELRRLLGVFRAYEHMNRGDEALEADDEERALREYGDALKRYPDSQEIRFWCGVSLANTGQLEQALPIFAEVFRAHLGWRTLTERIYNLGLLEVENQDYQKIISTGGAGEGK
jgi:uncharacterized Ntn-hydrolase superfamily protein